MKPEVTLKYLSYLQTKKEKGEGGFTLIELLVVVIIIGVLAAVALPNLLGQVGKARETELKNTVGTINRSQQTYHFEKQTFADGGSATDNLGIKIPQEYQTTPPTVTGTAASAGVFTTNSDAAKDGTRAYSGRIDFTAATGVYTQAICQSNAIVSTINLPTNASACTDGTILR